MIDPDVADAALAPARASDADWCELYVEARERRSVRCDGRDVELRGDVEVGACVRVSRHGRTALASTNDVSPAGLAQACSAAMTLLGCSTGDHRAQLDTGPGRRPEPVDSLRPPVETLQAQVQRAREAADSALAADRRVRRVAVALVEVVQRVMIVTADGVHAHDARSRTRLTCRVTARDAATTSSAFDGPGASGVEASRRLRPDEIGRAAADRAVLGLDALDLDSARLPVVLGPAGGGLLLHEACGHGLEADALVRGSSVFARTRGARVAGTHVTVVDDPTVPGGFGSYLIDDEGRTAAPAVLIDAGVQVASMTDATTAPNVSTPRSANGRRESHAHAPQPRMSNTHLAAGTDSAEAIVAGVPRGVYVATLSGGDVDPATGEFAFVASSAHLIEDGHLTAPLAGVTLLGHGPSVLATIDAVGDDLAFTQALCGKGGQWVPVSYGSPTLLVRRMRVTGARRG